MCIRDRISYAPWNEFIPGSAGKILDIMKVRIDSDDPYNLSLIHIFNSPFTSSRIPFIVNPVFFNVHDAVDLSISISVCKEAATLLINNSPCCQKRIFLFSNSTPNEETPVSYTHLISTSVSGAIH